VLLLFMVPLNGRLQYMPSLVVCSCFLFAAVCLPLFVAAERLPAVHERQL
jgi:hypothetical protein